MHALVVGATSWGCTLAMLVVRAGGSATVLCRSAEEAVALAASREQRRLLPGIALPEALAFTAEAPRQPQAEIVIWAVPAQRLRDNVRRRIADLPVGVVHVSAAKGLEAGSGTRMSVVLAEELEAAGVPGRIAALSGPNLAREIALGLPAASVAASEDADAAAQVQRALGSASFRVYTNADLVGVELGGALKNVIALAAGMAEALQVGDNARAALITRGLAEMGRLSAALGADPLTFAGLAGLGDLLATTSSSRSRNRGLGEALGRGQSLEQALAATPHVVEGVETTRAVRELARRTGVEMPIVELVARVLFEGLRPAEALPELMARAPQDEAPQRRRLNHSDA